MIENKESNTVIDVSHLTKDYGSGRGIFDVSIKVHKGECYGYLGPNGAGKSTTIRHIMGFSKPQSGSIRILGQDVFGNTHDILKNVGYLPGELSMPEGLDGWGFIRMMQDLKGERKEERLAYLLKTFDLDPEISIKQMSAGEKRKLAIVAAFMDDPDILVLDEPTSGLDPIMQRAFIDFIIEEKKRGKTIILSSHIFSEVEETCDTVAIIKDGIHISTFRADELKTLVDRSYIVRTADKKSFDKLKNSAFDIISESERELCLEIKVSSEEYRELFARLEELNVVGFEQREYKIEDHFMSFYKEEKEFSGLDGIQETEGKGEEYELQTV